MAFANEENGGWFARAWCWCRTFVFKKYDHVARITKKLWKEDGRRIIHSMKVGLAINLVSFLYYVDPLYEGLGLSAIWAVITVVLNCEYFVGATLGKGIIGSMATLVAITLGIGAHFLTTFSGNNLEPLLIAIFVFIIAAIATFARFFPKIKGRYEYGCILFIVTGCSVIESGYRENVIDIVRRRLMTFFIGGFSAVATCIFICPVWAGADLHNALAVTIEKLGTFLEGFGGKYFTNEGDVDNQENKVLLDGYKSILNSKGTLEALANHAIWEPGHGRFKYKHPWDQYLKIAALARECAYSIEALNSYLNSKTQVQISGVIGSDFEDLCIKLSVECSNLLKELVMEIKTWTLIPSNVDLHIENAKSAAEKLESWQKSVSWHEGDLLQIISSITVASLLLDVFNSTLKIAQLVNELGCLAKFNNKDAQALMPN